MPIYGKQPPADVMAKAKAEAAQAGSGKFYLRQQRYINGEMVEGSPDNPVELSLPLKVVRVNGKDGTCSVVDQPTDTFLVKASGAAPAPPPPLVDPHPKRVQRQDHHQPKGEEKKGRAADR